MNTGNTVNPDSTETKQTKRNTCCGCSSVAAVVPEDVVAKDLVTKGTKDSLTKDPVNHVATQEVAQVTKGRSGGSAKVKAKRRELQMKSADMLQSFSYVCRMFHFGSSRLFQHVFDDHEPNTIETDVLFKTNVETNDETTDSDDEFMSCCDYMSCCDVSDSEKSQHDKFCQDDHDTSGYMEWKYHEGRTGPGQSDRKCRCDWTFVDPCFRMMRGFPQVEDLTQDEVDDSDVMVSWVIGLRKVRFLKLTPHHLPIQRIWKVGVPMNLFCQNAQTHQMVQRDQIWSAVSLNWVMDVSGWNMSAGAIGLMTGDVMIACSQEDAHLLGE